MENIKRSIAERLGLEQHYVLELEGDAKKFMWLLHRNIANRSPISMFWPGAGKAPFATCDLRGTITENRFEVTRNLGNNTYFQPVAIGNISIDKNIITIEVDQPFEATGYCIFICTILIMLTALVVSSGFSSLMVAIFSILFIVTTLISYLAIAISMDNLRTAVCKELKLLARLSVQ
jgi:hypothetical protein